VTLCDWKGGDSAMPSGSRDEEHDHKGRRQAQAAGDLSDRAAESVDRRYDVTKEIYHGERQQEINEHGVREQDETDRTEETDENDDGDR
jgi:hypothetical protein